MTDAEKEKLYLNPVVSQEEGLRNKIANLPRVIKGAEKDLNEFIFIKDEEFSSKVRVEFNHIGISKKELIVKIYKTIISDWKKELKKSRLDLKLLLNE